MSFSSYEPHPRLHVCLFLSRSLSPTDYILVLPSPSLIYRCRKNKKKFNRWLRKNWGSSQGNALGNVPIPAVSEFSGFQLACLHPALCPEWRQQDFPASFANIWCLGLPARGGGAPGYFPSDCVLHIQHLYLAQQW